MQSIAVKIKTLPHFKGLPLPAYQTAAASGLDLPAAVKAEGLLLAAGAYALVPTGLTMELPKGYEAQVRPRSGLAARHGIGVLNSPGTIDADYRGEVQVILINHGKEDLLISRGMRIAQMVIAPVYQADLRVLGDDEELAASDRGSGGFGHTGV
ncbi:MAG: dUTP diphosphatase [Clostridiales bacterium]|nr:dUTP diphosphatase [Clostridiales bacterium]